MRRRQIVRRRHLSDAALLAHISAVYAEHRGAYGWPRICRELVKRGIRVGKRRVQRLMQQHGIRARGKRRFRVTITDSRHDLPIAPNVLRFHLQRRRNTACRRRAVPWIWTASEPDDRRGSNELQLCLGDCQCTETALDETVSRCSQFLFVPYV